MPDIEDVNVKVSKVSKGHVLIQEIDDEVDKARRDFSRYDELGDADDDLDDLNRKSSHSLNDSDYNDIYSNSDSDDNSDSAVQTTTKPFPRLHLLDAYRGFVVLVMIAYHFSYDLFVLLKGNYAWPGITSVFIWEQYICWSFNLLSGFVWHLGKKHSIRNGIIVNLCGFLCTFITMVIMPEAPIIFGVLNLLGCSMILMYPLSLLFRKAKGVIGSVVSFLLFAFFYGTPRGFLGFFMLPIIKLPNSLYISDIFAPYGFPSRTFVSSDYFPILPWFFLYITGFFLWKVISPKIQFQRIATKKIPVLDYIGKHSLMFYLIHQPLCFALIYGYAFLASR